MAICTNVLIFKYSHSLTDEVHADPVPRVHLLLDVPADDHVLGLANSVARRADHERGSALGGHQVRVAGGSGQRQRVVVASSSGEVLLGGEVESGRPVLAPAPALGAP